jgi:hypothetical protein
VIGRTFDRVPGELIALDEWPGKLTREYERSGAAA